LQRIQQSLHLELEEKGRGEKKVILPKDCARSPRNAARSELRRKSQVGGWGEVKNC